MTDADEIQYPKVHFYLSTACYHELHDKCRLTCKYCARDCLCVCHTPLEHLRVGPHMKDTNYE